MRRNRPQTGEVEHRMVRSPVEIRASDDGSSIGFTGHAAVFEQRTWIGPPKWGFWETIRRGAFRKTITEGDIRMLFNHNPDLPLARNTVASGPGSLRLSEDETGLLDEADMLPTTYARDLALTLDSGVVSQQSFSFLPVNEEWSVDEVTGEETRELIEVKLFDVGPVTFPAFTETDASLRSVGYHLLMDALDVDEESREALLTAVRSGDIPPSLTPALRAARTALDALVQSAGEPATPPLPAAPAATPTADRLRRQMGSWKDIIEGDKTE